MSAEDNAPTGLATEPLNDSGPGTKTKKKSGRKQISQAVTANQSNGKSFQNGDLVLFHVKHLHGLHGSIVMEAGQGQYVVRGNEQQIEGQLFQFSAAQLEPATLFSLKEHHSTRLEWDYPED